MYDLIPFRRAIDGGVKSIMVGHLALPALDDAGLPATMSRRIVSDLLREQLGFKGLIITDAMMMGGVTERFDPGDAAVKALQAGCDVLLMGKRGVDGVYDADPHTHPDAVRFDTLSYDDVIGRDLKVADSTAFSLCRDNGMPIIVFELADGNIARVVRGEKIGTLVTGSN